MWRTTVTPTAVSSSTIPASYAGRLRHGKLFAQAILAKEPGGRIYDVGASWAVPEVILEAEVGVPLVNRVGHAFIKRRMREEDAVFAGEVSAHYYFRDFTQADSGIGCRSC